MGGVQSSGKRKKKRPRNVEKSSTERDLARQSGFDLFDDPDEVEEEESEDDTDEEPVVRQIAPPSQLLCLDISSIVELTVRCEALHSSKPTFVVMYSKWAKDEHWVEIGMTETNSNNTFDPQFKKTVQLEFRMEMTRELRFEVFHFRAPHPMDQLEEHEYVGCMESSLAEVFAARAAGVGQPLENHGWFAQNLENPLKFAGKDMDGAGKVCIYAEELLRSKQLISWAMSATGIVSRDRWKNFGRGSPDAYCVVQKCRYQAFSEQDDPEVVLEPVYRTEVCRKSKLPDWDRCTIPVSSLCHMDEKQEFVIEVFDWFRVSEAEYIGECSTNYWTLFQRFKDSKPIVLQLVAKEHKQKKGILGRLRSRSKSTRGRSTSLPSRSPSSSVRGGSSRSPGHTHSPAPSHTTSKDEPRGSRGRSRTSSRLMHIDDRPADERASRTPPDPSRAGSKDPRTSSKEAGSKEAPRRPAGNTLLVPGADKPSKLSGTSKLSGGSKLSGVSKLSIRSANSAKSERSRDSDGKGSGRKITRSSGAADSTSSGKSSREGKETKEKVVGCLTLNNVGSQRRFTFLDYVRSGMQIRLAMAIDFTRSNAKREPHCHGFGGTPGTSPYATAIRAVGKVMSSYDLDEKVLAYGFGARIPPSHTVVSDCWALSGDYFEPELEGIDEVVKSYQRALQIVEMHGPTRLSPVIKLVSSLAQQYHEPRELARDPMIYYLLVVVTDGQVKDELDTINAIVESADVPMSTVVIGMGPDEDHSFLKDLSQEVARIRRLKAPDGALKRGHAAEHRQVVHYVPYQMYEDSPEELAGAALADVPREVVGYFQGLNINPFGLGRFEDKHGLPAKKFLPTEMSESGPNSRSRSRASTRPGSKAIVGAGSRSATNDLFGGRTKSTIGGESLASDGSMGRYLSGITGTEAKDEVKRQKRAQPAMLLDLKGQLIKGGVDLGYSKNSVLRALQEGLPAATLDVLVDNVMYSGHGRAPPYRAAARQALPQHQAPAIPGQVEERTTMTTTRTTISRQGSDHSTKFAKRMPLLRKSNSRADDWDNDGGVSEMWGGSVRRKGSLGSRRGSSDSEASKGSREESGQEEGPWRPRGITKDAQLAAQALLRAAGAARADEAPPPPAEPAIKGILSRKTTKHFEEQGEEDKEKYKHFSRKGTRFAEDLVQEVERSRGAELVQHRTTSKSNVRFSQDRVTCSICLEQEVATQLQPCGHLLACEACAPKLGATCPLCQGAIREVVP